MPQLMQRVRARPGYRTDNLYPDNYSNQRDEEVSPLGFLRIAAWRSICHLPFGLAPHGQHEGVLVDLPEPPPRVARTACPTLAQSHRPRRDRLNSSTSHTPAAPIIKPAPTSTKGRRPAAFAISNAARASPATSRVLARRKESVRRMDPQKKEMAPSYVGPTRDPMGKHSTKHEWPRPHTSTP